MGKSANIGRSGRGIFIPFNCIQGQHRISDIYLEEGKSCILGDSVLMCLYYKTKASKCNEEFNAEPRTGRDVIMSIQKLLETIDREKRLYETGKERIAKAVNGDTVNPLPLIFWKSRNAGTPGKTYNLKEQFYDKEKMLHGHLEEIEEICSNAFDAQLCIRPNFGTIFVPAMFGLEYKVFEDNYPWLTTHLSKEELMNFNMPDLAKNQLMAKAVEYIEYFIEMVPDYIHIYQPDTQGPFDIAHLVYGDNIFLQFFDDPKFVHELMEICTEMYIEVSKRLKKVIGEDKNKCYHGHALARGIYLDNGGIRISEDSATLISPEHIDEFVVPYVKKALMEFGGGYIHFCGNSVPLLDAFLKIDEVRAINFGNPEKYDFYETMKKFLDHGKCYFGLWPKKDEETARQYIKRMKDASEGGTRALLLHFNEAMFPQCSCNEILDIWNKAI